jgi:hypothetical protein
MGTGLRPSYEDSNGAFGPPDRIPHRVGTRTSFALSAEEIVMYDADDLIEIRS